VNRLCIACGIQKLPEGEHEFFLLPGQKDEMIHEILWRAQRSKIQ
jgi:hypothetical protein